MPNGTYWWCERGEKISPTRFQKWGKTCTNKSIPNYYIGIQIFYDKKIEFGIAWIQTGRIWRELWQNMILR